MSASNRYCTEVGVTELGKRGRRLWRPSAREANRGNIMLEFALFFMLFLGLALGLMELGLAMWSHTTVAHAARAGARYAQVHGSAFPIDTGAGDLTVEEVVRENAVGLAYKSDMTVTTTYNPANWGMHLTPEAPRSSIRALEDYSRTLGSFKSASPSGFKVNRCRPPAGRNERRL